MLEIDYLTELFLSTSMWGFFGPFALVVFGWWLAEKSEWLGVLWFIVECLCCSIYFDLLAATPQYWWNIFFILMGGLTTCIFPILGRRR